MTSQITLHNFCIKVAFVKGNQIIKSVSTNLSKVSEFHTSKMIDNINKMIKLEEVIVPANSSLFFQPGKKHIMIMNIKSSAPDKLQ